MKVFQILNGICYHKEKGTLDEMNNLYRGSIKLVEAPDCVEEGWSYDSSKTGDERFVRPVFVGKTWDDELGRYVEDGTEEDAKREKYENRVKAYIRTKYSVEDEFKVLREALANSDDGATEAFQTYNAFVIECKNKAQTEVYGS